MIEYLIRTPEEVAKIVIIFLGILQVDTCKSKEEVINIFKKKLKFYFKPIKI